MAAEKIKQIKHLLDDVLKDISLHEEYSIDQKKVQLFETAKTINKLQTKNIPVPNEITVLKLKLVKEIDTLSNHEKEKNELIQLLDQALKRLTNEKKIAHYSIAENYQLKRRNVKKDQRVLSYIEKNRILFPLKIHCKVRDQKYFAVINADGTFNTTINNEVHTLTSLNQLTILTTGFQRDGWSLWKTDLDGETTFLKDLIKKNEI